MRKETYKVMRAFLDRKSARGNNTTTDGNAVWLFGNKIAWRAANGDINITLAGWNTVTTRERLNGLLVLLNGQRDFHQRDHVPYFRGAEVTACETITLLNLA